jgi:hypothetical protein
LPFENLEIHWDSNSQNENSLGNVGVHSFALSYTFGSMKCESQASLLARTLASLCLVREPKAKVVTTHVLKNLLQDAMLESTVNAFFFMFCYIYSSITLLAFTIFRTKIQMPTF